MVPVHDLESSETILFALEAQEAAAFDLVHVSPCLDIDLLIVYSCAVQETAHAFFYIIALIV